MGRKRRSHQQRHGWRQWGFTLIEMMVIVMVVGVLSAIAAPSFGALMDNIKVSQTVSDLRLALQDTQRQAIRANKTCQAQFVTKTSHSKTEDSVSGNCLTSGNPDVPKNLQVANNIQPDASLSGGSTTVSVITFNPIGSAEFSVATTVQPPNLPSDPSGKLVVLIPTKTQVKKKCVAISSTLGLTRIGTYTGGTE
ncbi:MAG: prepilin-type N-terminal cleavage/methylation domain-containing protein, partial [Thermosynechococcaceae cyanobacterium]